MNDVNHLSQLRILEDGILHILVARQSHPDMLARLSLPFGNGLQPELRKMIRSRIFLANRLNHVRLISKGIQHLHDILLMQLAHHRIIYIIEVFSHPYTLITCKRNRFREHRTIDIVDWAPWTIYPMGTCLQDIMLEIVLVDNQQTILGSLFCQFLNAADVPRIQLCKVILTQSVPSRALSASGKRLLIERSPDISITAAHTFVVITAAVIPQAVVLVEEHHMLITKMSHHTIHTGGSALSLHSRHKTGHGIGNLRESRVTNTSVPPRGIHSCTLQQRISHHDFTLLYREDRLPGMGKIRLFLRTFLDFIHIHSPNRRNRSHEPGAVCYPHQHGDARFARLFHHLLCHIIGRIIAHIVAFSLQHTTLD